MEKYIFMPRMATMGKVSLKFPVADEIVYFQGSPEAAIALRDAVAEAHQKMPPKGSGQDKVKVAPLVAPSSMSKDTRRPQSAPALLPSQATQRPRGTTVTVDSQLPKSLSRFCDIELDAQQRKVVELIRGGSNILITGGAGVGKSYLVREVITKLLDASCSAITGSTGIAAMHLGGITLHRFAGIRNPHANDSIMLRDIMDNPATVARWQRTKVLIIDEISMIEGALFDKLEWVARQVRKSTKPFGGIQVILCGDFLQLPPVCVRPQMKQSSSSAVTDNKSKFTFAFEGHSWSRCVPHCIELTRVYRQTDSQFVHALNQLRFGFCDEKTAKDLLSRKLPNRLRQSKATSQSKKESFVTRLMPLRREVDVLNAQENAKLSGKETIFTAFDKLACGEEFGNFDLDGYTPVRKQLSLKVGAQVLLMKTVNAPRGLVNGLRGIIRSIDDLTGQAMVEWMTGLKTFIERETFVIRCGGTEVATRVQLPLELAWAVSIHKSQGLTLDCVEVAFENIFEEGQAYVALSRAKSSRRLYISGAKTWTDLVSKIRCNSRAYSFYMSLRGVACLCSRPQSTSSESLFPVRSSKINDESAANAGAFPP